MYVNLYVRVQSIYVRMYVGLSESTDACMYVCVYVCMNLCLYVCMYMHVYVHVCMYVCLFYVCMFSLITVVFKNQRMRLAGLYANRFLCARDPSELHGLVVAADFGVSYPLVFFL